MITTTPTEMYNPSGDRFVLRHGGWHSEDCDYEGCAGHTLADANWLYGPLTASDEVQP